MPILARTPRFKKNFRKKTAQSQASILRALEKLGVDPAHPGLRSKRVQGTDRVWESRVDGANRLTWEWGADGAIVLRNNCNHDVPAKSP